MDRPSRRTVAVYLLYLALSIVFCSPLLARPAALGIFDWDQHFFYYAQLLKNVVEYAQPPFWSPWYCGGNVMWQNPQVALLSPVYPVAAIAGLAVAMKISIVLHYWIGFIGMHLLLTRVIGLSFLPVTVYLASVFTLAGAIALHLAVGHSVFLPAFYFPLLLYFMIRALQTNAVRPALYGGAVLALMIYNGGLHTVPMAILAVTAFAGCVGVAERRWQPLVLALALLSSGAAYAAPKLVPVSLFVTGDRFWDSRDRTDHPDRMTPELMLRAYADRTQEIGSRFSAVQRHSWWEYGNYIGTLATVLIAASLVWLLVRPAFAHVNASARRRAKPAVPRVNGGAVPLGTPLAVTSVLFLVLSAGEFSVLAPAALLQHVPLFSSFRIPSRYTIAFVLFGTLATAVAFRALLANLRWTRTRQFAASTICVIAVVQLMTVNSSHLRNTFSLPPLDAGFHALKGSGALTRDVFVNPYAPNAPMLRALMNDQSVMWCYEGLQLKRGADDQHPLVWTTGQARISSIAFTPNRVQFSLIGGGDRSRIFLNQNYSPGWRSSAGPVLLDPQAGGRMYVEVAPGQTGRFSFSFIPPGLMSGTALFLLGLVLSALAWHRYLPSTIPRPTGDVRAEEPLGADAVSLAARVERLSKPVILISIAFAIATRVIIGGANQTTLMLMGIGGFAAAFVLSLRLPSAIALVLASTYVAPLVVARFLVLHDSLAYQTFWMSGLLGAMLPRWSLRRWSLPAAWRVPLVGWALAAAVAWPIIVAREFDFNPDPFALLTRPTSAIGLPAGAAAVLIADAGALLMLAVLWMDWLFAMFSEDLPRFRRIVIGPVLASGTIAFTVAAYQFFGHITFVNEGWASLGRASATLMDANALGMVAVLCSCGFLTSIDRHGLAISNVAAAAGVVLACAGVWASGSKTALIAELVTFVFAAWSLTSRAGYVPAPRGHRSRFLRVAIAFGLAGTLLFALADSGPVRRMGWMLPTPSVAAAGAFARQLLWDRDGYGTAAVEMIRQSPWVGVGVGSFPIIVSDYRYSHLKTFLNPDNAQNWSRHHLAEFGIVGSLGWIVWAVVLISWVARRRAGARDSRQGTILAGGLIGVVAVSQVGLPMTSVVVAMTFWTFVFWYFAARRASQADARSTRATVASWQWLLMSALLVVFTAGTLRAAVTTLRVPMRARNAGWDYSYGFSRAELTPSGEEFRWMQQYAALVVPAATRVAKLTIWVSRRDVAANPVIARVWHDERLVIDTVFRDNKPVSTYVVIDRDPQWLMVTTYLDRVLPPNARELGLALQWTFVDAVPDEHKTASKLK